MKWFCWHDWSKWKTYIWQGSIARMGVTTKTTLTKQARVCVNCGKEVHRRVYEADGLTYDTAKPVAQHDL